MGGPGVLAIGWNGLKNQTPALEYVTIPALAIEWDGWRPKCEGGNQIYKPPIVQEVRKVNVESCNENVKNVVIQNVENVIVKNVENVEAKNVQNVIVKNVVSATGMKTVMVKRKIWTQRKNGLFGWSYKTVKTEILNRSKYPH